MLVTGAAARQKKDQGSDDEGSEAGSEYSVDVRSAAKEEALAQDISEVRITVLYYSPLGDQKTGL